MADDYGAEPRKTRKPRKPYDREVHRKQVVESDLRRKVERRTAIERLKSSPCTGCKGQFPYYVMDYDHRNSAEKDFEINARVTNLSWARVLAEIAKCDLVCVCCHRLRSWKKPVRPRGRQKLIQVLKDVPCKDCLGKFHYCQMDFDHVRGEKLGQVPKMSSAEAIVQEAAKCDVVCANCHRKRSHKQARGTPRLKPEDVDMVWKYRTSKNPQTRVRNDGAPAYRPWHSQAGTAPDRVVAGRFAVSRGSVTKYRLRAQIRAWSKSL